MYFRRHFRPSFRENFSFSQNFRSIFETKGRKFSIKFREKKLKKIFDLIFSKKFHFPEIFVLFSFDKNRFFSISHQSDFKQKNENFE